jgi:hypothetical protein
MAESLTKQVRRATARWLKRAMNSTALTSTQKLLAYAVADRLNCVTLDCWPTQSTLAQTLGCISSKTVQRAAKALQTAGVVVIKRQKDGRSRYAPNFVAEDWDTPGGVGGQSTHRRPDTGVHQSNLAISSTSSSTGRAAGQRQAAGPAFNNAERGSWEATVARRLGPNGWETLSRLNALDSRTVERLCRAQADGTLGERELNAARLASKQMP